MNNNFLLLGGAGVLAFVLLNKSGSSLLSSAAATTTPTASNPAGLVGIFQGQQVTNYAQLVAANPNIGNPNYVMTPGENAQYLANYLDLQQGLPSWVGKKIGGQTIGNLQQAAQAHWQMYGAAERRVFVPLSTEDLTPYRPPVSNPNSSGGSSSFLSGALSLATTILPMVLGPDQKLNNADCQLLFTGAYIIKDILPMYATSDRETVNVIDYKLNNLLKQYA